MVQTLYSESTKYPVLPNDCNRYIGDRNEGYAISSTNGFLYFNESTGGWTLRNNGLSRKVVYPFVENEVRRISALGVDPNDFKRVAVSDGKDVYLTLNQGIEWVKIENGGGLANSAYITALLPDGLGGMYAGTSTRGIFQGFINGTTVKWKRLSQYRDGYYKGGGSFEEVKSLWKNSLNGEHLLASFGFRGGLYTSLIDAEGIGGWIKQVLPFKEDVIGFYRYGNYLHYFTKDEIYRQDLVTHNWVPLPYNLYRLVKLVNKEKIGRLDQARDRKGIYIRWDKAAHLESYQKLLNLISKQGYNSFVVDMKNDQGVLTYDSKIPTALELNAVSNKIHLQKLLEAAHQKGIYVIARVVVFKDKQFYRYKNKSYAVWDDVNAKPWGNYSTKTNASTGKSYTVQREYWVDPFSIEVWEYNRQIAQELQQMGVDEIQFDYIRFPSDGEVQNCSYRFQKKGMSRMDALESFLKYVRSSISIPISTDLYGYQSYYRMGNWIGQNIEIFSHYVDVISPMYYPSHFAATFLDHSDYAQRSKNIYYTGCNRSFELAEGRCVIRPYVQAFLISDEREMEEAEYKRYLRKQLEGVSQSSGDGFTLWNNSNNYYMLD